MVSSTRHDTDEDANIPDGSANQNLSKDAPSPSPEASTQPPAYSVKDPLPKKVQSGQNEPPPAAVSNASAPTLEPIPRISAIVDRETINIHPEGPPPRYESVVVTEPKLSPTTPAVTSVPVPPDPSPDGPTRYYQSQSIPGGSDGCRCGCTDSVYTGILACCAYMWCRICLEVTCSVCCALLK